MKCLLWPSTGKHARACKPASCNGPGSVGEVRRAFRKTRGHSLCEGCLALTGIFTIHSSGGPWDLS